MATDDAGVLAVGRAVDGGGGGGGAVEFGDASSLFVAVTVPGGGDVDGRLSPRGAGDDNGSLPLTCGTDAVSPAVSELAAGEDT